MPHRRYHAFCQERHASAALRTLRTCTRLPGGQVEMGGRHYLDFSSNDYLGLAHHPLLVQRAMDYAARFGAGSGAARLVTGNHPAFAAVEERMARGKGSQAALIFASGYQANAAMLSALLDRRVLEQKPLVFSDRLNHGSIHHGCAAAGVHQIRYRHRDLNHLEDLLKKHAGSGSPRFILTETVFSMDGDQVDLAALIALKERFGAFLYLDEAHATGVLGPDGFGLSAAFPQGADLVMGTFSKALGSFGAYAACSLALRDYLVNAAGGFIYATALPPTVLGAMEAALELLPALEGERRRLQERGQRVRQAFHNSGLDTGDSSTQIIPLMTGSSEQALAGSAALQDKGILAVAIRPPTVPVGKSRLRFSLSTAHDEAALERMLSAVLEIAP